MGLLGDELVRGAHRRWHVHAMSNALEKAAPSLTQTGYDAVMHNCPQLEAFTTLSHVTINIAQEAMAA